MDWWLPRNRPLYGLCNNINDTLFRSKFSYSKLVKIGYKQSLLLKYFQRFCSAYNIEGKYGEKNSDLLFSRMLKHNPFVSCNINNIKEINDIVKSSYVKIMPKQGVLSVNGQTNHPFQPTYLIL